MCTNVGYCFCSVVDIQTSCQHNIWNLIFETFLQGVNFWNFFAGFGLSLITKYGNFSEKENNLFFEKKKISRIKPGVQRYDATIDISMTKSWLNEWCSMFGNLLWSQEMLKLCSSWMNSIRILSNEWSVTLDFDISWLQQQLHNFRVRINESNLQIFVTDILQLMPDLFRFTMVIRV